MQYPTKNHVVSIIHEVGIGDVMTALSRWRIVLPHSRIRSAGHGDRIAEFESHETITPGDEYGMPPASAPADLVEYGSDCTPVVPGHTPDAHSRGMGLDKVDPSLYCHNTMTMHSRFMRAQAFSALELIVVISILVALMALALPAYRYVRINAQIGTARQVVRSVDVAIETYGARSWPVFANGALIKNLPLWDMNGDGILDGKNESPAFPAGSVGYLGFLDQTKENLVMSKQFYDPATRRVVDSWRRPLRIGIAYSAASTAANAGRYGGKAIGIWSVGPNGIDEQGDGDDICSWK